jgi:threonine dehydratase
MKIPEYQDVVQAHELIVNYAHRTPILTSASINALTGGDIRFKCENFQKGGAFKFRGAVNGVMSLGKKDAMYGVCTHSSGNHAAALALAARTRGIDAHVVMPENAAAIKKKAVIGYGAHVTFCAPEMEARESTLASILEKTGATEIHPYDSFEVIAGQGSVAKELLEDDSDFDIVLVPVGGGGLLAGTALAVKHLSPTTRLVACEPDGADDAYRSFLKGEIVPSIKPQTIADGLLTSLGNRNFAIIKEKVDDIVTVSEDAIIQAMRLVWERMKIIIEPSSAVPLAAVIEGKIDISNQKCGIIISGGNLDLGNLPFQ